MVVGWYRSNGEALLVVSTNLLHMFEQTMDMLPFATSTDMYEAVQNSKENKTTKFQEMLQDDSRRAQSTWCACTALKSLDCTYPCAIG